jgi:exoribonuclease-2
MNVFYEEDGGFKVGSVLADQGTALQVEAASGKRSKVKTNQILIRFDAPDAQALFGEASALSLEIDLDFLWQCAPAEEFGFEELATDYFGQKALATQNAALLMRMHSAPMYFYRRGRGRYKAAPADALKAALAGVERRRLQAFEKDQYVAELVNHRVPAPILAKVDELLFRPDKNSVEYKALEEAAARAGTTPARLLLSAGGVSSARELHERRFLFQHFPAGVEPRQYPFLTRVADLPLAPVEAFSIDDHTTTEIDDAFSVERFDTGFRIGIHIAVPALAIAPGDDNDLAARERFSTVYMPGGKITMLGAELIERFSLLAGSVRAALSLYVTIDAEGNIKATDSRLEQVAIAHNLRINQWDDRVTEDALIAAESDDPIMADLAVLWRLVVPLYQKRQAARVAAGLKPEARNRPDYNFYIGDAGDVEIVERRRDAPLDRLVAELMILANSTWGALLAEHAISGIYRGQQGFGPGGRVRMVTHPMPHQGLGVAQYAWSTSPLRRYVDLVNQWQILAALKVLPVAFEHNDAQLFAIVSGFEAAYAAYAEFQTLMERYWCLRFVLQQPSTLFEARLQREDLVVLVSVPLSLRIAALPGVARGTHLEVDIREIDEVDLSAQTRVMAIIEEVDAQEMPEDELLAEGAGPAVVNAVHP